MSRSKRCETANPAIASTKETTMDMKKNITRIGAGALGAAAITIGAAGVAGAQVDEPVVEEPTEQSTEFDRSSRRGQRRANRQARVDRVTTDFESVREALKAERQEAKAEKRQAVADVLGIDVEELQEARDSGSTLAEIAGDDLDALVDLFVGNATERIEAKVENGDLTQAEADERLDGLEDRITTRLEAGGKFGKRGSHKADDSSQETTFEA